MPKEAQSCLLLKFRQRLMTENAVHACKVTKQRCDIGSV